MSTVIICMGDPLARIGLRAIIENLEGDISVTETGSFAILLETLDSSAFDMAIVDLTLPGMNAFTGLKNLRSQHPHLRVCVIVESLTEVNLAQCLEASCLGCVRREKLADEIPHAIASITEGRPYFSRLTARSGTIAAEAPVNLTDQQTRVMEVLSQGKSNKEIARKLGICEGTVKVHVNAAYRALGVHNRVAAVMKFQQLFGQATLERQLDLPIGQRRPTGRRREDFRERRLAG